jgi:DNA-binding CsgD family transcriptional regulator
VARDVGIELTTVRTHQYRAFRRLGIRTQKELLLRVTNEAP